MKYRLIAPSLIEPSPGDVSVRPDTAITISVPAVANAKSKIIVRLAGQLIFERGRLSEGWGIEREWKIDGRHLIRFTTSRPLAQQDYLVQIEVVGLCRSINQRFVVQGARVDCPCPPDELAIRMDGGFFWIDGQIWRFPDRELEAPARYGRAIPIGEGCAVYRRAGIVAWRHQHTIHTCAVPKCLLEPQVKLSMIIHPDGDFSLSGCGIYTGALWLMHKQHLSHWPRARALDAAVTSGWLNVNMGDESRHVPLFYKKSPSDVDTSDFFSMKMYESMRSTWSMRWYNSKHIWYSRSSIIIHEKPNPYMNESEKRLIERHVINEDISSVENSGSCHILVNKKHIIKHSGAMMRSTI